MPGEVVKLDRTFVVIMCIDCNEMMNYEDGPGTPRCYKCGNILDVKQWRRLMAAKREIQESSE